MIEHASRRIRILGATAHPTAARVTQAVRNLTMDLEDAGRTARYVVRDRDGKFPGLFDAILADAGIRVVLSGVQMPRMNSIMQRWIQRCRQELLDRTLICNQRHLLHALHEYERHHNAHRPYRGTPNARPLRPLPEPITDPDAITRLGIRRRDRLGGVLHKYEHAARRVTRSHADRLLIRTARGARPVSTCRGQVPCKARRSGRIHAAPLETPNTDHGSNSTQEHRPHSHRSPR